MNAMLNKMLNHYGQAQTDAAVESASPHKLILMLYEGALVAIAHAGLEMQHGNPAARGMFISKAIAIIDEGLKISIDMESGGGLSENLKSLYDYMSRRLLEANLRGDAVALGEVERLLKELKGAWEQIGHPKPAAASPPTAPPHVAGSYGRA